MSLVNSQTGKMLRASRAPKVKTLSLTDFSYLYILFFFSRISVVLEIFVLTPGCCNSLL